MLVAPTAGPDQEPSSVIDALLAQQGLRRRIVLSVAHFLVAPFVVASSDLVLTSPSRLLEPFIRSLGLRRLHLPLPSLDYTLSQVWSARAADDPAHRWLRGLIAKTLATK
jgi:DNA-binding transcriptional LysR family regulator